MKKSLFYLISLSFSFTAFSQWKIENINDGFENSTFIRTEIYKNTDEGCKQPCYLALVDNDIFLVADCSIGSKTDNWYIDVILMVNGIEYRFKTLDEGGHIFKRKILLLNKCLNININNLVSVKNETNSNFLDLFLMASELKVKAKNNFYETIYFKTVLTPSNTELAWDANTGGRFLAKKKQQEELIKLENQKKEADKATIEKINELLASNVIENAANEYSKLNFQNSETKALIQQKLNEKYTSEILNLDSTAIKKYISANKKKLISINPGKYKLSFDKTGNSSIKEFPNYSDVPKKLFGTFEVLLKSQAEIILELKDSILVSSIYSSSWTKPLYKDKNDNFYYKTKTGLPIATIYDNSLIDKTYVKVSKNYYRYKYANGILIDSQEFQTNKMVKILKKDQ
jgi:hypothetical protein